MEIIRSVTRYVPRYSRHQAPCGQLAEVCLKRGNTGVYVITTPWACFAGSAETTEDDLVRSLPNSFDNESDACDEAMRRAPHWHSKANERVRDRLDDSERWDGSIVGPSSLADAIGVHLDHVYEIASGTRKATKLQGQKAHDFGGCVGRGF